VPAGEPIMTRSAGRRALIAGLGVGLAAMTALAAAIMLAGAGAGAGVGGRADPVGRGGGAVSSPGVASAAGVPAAPPGWLTVFADGFNGPAGSPPSSSWRYVIGPPVSFGNGAVEIQTGSTSNGYLDGHGDLDITAREQGDRWTSARVQTVSPDIAARPGGKLEVVASIAQPDPVGGLG
jgi:hypothetical protein